MQPSTTAALVSVLAMETIATASGIVQLDDVYCPPSAQQATSDGFQAQ